MDRMPSCKSSSSCPLFVFWCVWCVPRLIVPCHAPALHYAPRPPIVARGGGFVTVHAANNSFSTWKAYNRMIGLGGWGGRTEKDGPYV
jgi:hypothetical protein